MTLFLIMFIIAWGLLAYDGFYPGTADWRGIMQALSQNARPTDTFVLRGEAYSSGLLSATLSGRKSDAIANGGLG